MQHETNWDFPLWNRTEDEREMKCLLWHLFVHDTNRHFLLFSFHFVRNETAHRHEPLEKSSGALSFQLCEVKIWGTGGQTRSGWPAYWEYCVLDLLLDWCMQRRISEKVRVCWFHVQAACNGRILAVHNYYLSIPQQLSSVNDEYIKVSLSSTDSLLFFWKSYREILVLIGQPHKS